MKHGHESVKERLPEYLAGGLTEEEKAQISAHIDECFECRQELALLERVHDFEVPDPGELFWKTLPQKVALLSKERREKKLSPRLLLQPIPLVVIVCVIAIGLAPLLYRHFSNGKYYDPFFKDPISASMVDENTMTDEDLITISENLDIEDSNLEILEDINYENSYHGELVSLSSEEANSIYQKLNNQQKQGGVL